MYRFDQLVPLVTMDGGVFLILIWIRFFSTFDGCFCRTTITWLRSSFTLTTGLMYWKTKQANDAKSSRQRLLLEKDVKKKV